jgi:uncharacterized RmlC-like cupin family protein
MVGKNGEKMSPWMNKLERYTVTLQPGDLLMNPPWFWHVSPSPSLPIPAC